MKWKRMWKEVVRKGELSLDEEGNQVLTIKSPDPSLRDQLRERHNLLDSDRAFAYLQACGKAPNASEGTKKKWKKALGLT